MVSPLVSDILIFALFVFIYLILYRIVIIVIKRIDQSRPGKSPALNSLKVVLRFVLIFLIGFSAFSLFEIDSTVLLSLSSVSGIIIGFASTEIVTQFISGIYLVSARPFSINDLVRIDSIEGLVIEINLNYCIIKQFDGTIIKIPNKRMMDSKFHNFTMKIEDLREQSPVSLSKDSTNQTANNNNSSKSKDFYSIEKFTKKIIEISDLITENYLTRYTFKIEIELARDPQQIIGILTEICKEFKSVYGYTPKFAIVNTDFRAVLKFWVFCVDPQKIMDQQNNFIQAIAHNLYSSKALEEEE